MARPPKIGLSYYSVDTDRYQDKRLKRLKHNMGVTGLAVYDYILCEVYRDKGCFLAWDENTAFDVASYLGLKESTVNEVVAYCGAVGLFEKELLSRGIITSRSIQLRYKDICKAAKKTCSIPKELDLTTEETAFTPVVTPLTPEESTQRKEKENKGKESKGDLERANFYIGVKPIREAMSSHFPREFAIFYEPWAMNNGLEKARAVLEKMDSDYLGYKFNDDNHVQRAFLATAKALSQTQPKKPGISGAIDAVQRQEELLKKKHGIQ